MARGNPDGLKTAGFKDDPSRRDKEELRLERELIPGWVPERSMKRPRPAVMTLPPNLGPGGKAPETAARQLSAGRHFQVDAHLTQADAIATFSI